MEEEKEKKRKRVVCHTSANWHRVIDDGPYRTPIDRRVSGITDLCLASARSCLSSEMMRFELNSRVERVFSLATIESPSSSSMPSAVLRSVSDLD